ncbi:MAG: DUF1549 and DUF1553 domain-containing protein [Chthoniobacteraceae bacterium]
MTTARTSILCVLFFAASAAAKERPWSFKPLARPAVPAVKNTAWLKDGLDVFILAKLEGKNVAPNPDADRATLLRRASYDLTGLPPTPEELDAFLRDPANDDAAFAKVLDRLLASPRFGERWARHWLDVVHYADSIGRTMNAVFPYAFRYRDYVIDSLNADKPYNRFVGEQVAGDLLPWKTPAERSENLTATGFLTFASLDLSETGAQFEMDRVDDQIDVSTRAFLGLTVACARCHYHKTDPITQEDYYALAGIFYSTATWPGVAGKGDLGPNGYVDEDKLVRLPAAAPAALARTRSTAAADAMMDAPTKGYPTIFRFLPDRVMGVSEGEIGDCEVRIKGDPHDRGDAPPRGSIDIPGLPKIAAIPKGESGRLQLAQWLVSPQNPLTARVMVNRVWQHLFGAGLVRTVDDFGITGEAPTHPELLDHLTVRFVEGGWSVKKLIRATMLSRTYRMSSAGRSPNPDDDLYWRMRPRRLELEPIRDTLLLAGGALKFERPEGIQVAGFGGKGREARARSLMREDAPYRTIFVPVLRSLLPSMHELFDFADPSQIKGQRDVTTVAAQALYFVNNEFVADMARGAAEALLAEKGDEAKRIELAYLRVLARKPTPEEIADARSYLEKPGDWATFVQALFASAEFRYVL